MFLHSVAAYCCKKSASYRITLRYEGIQPHTYSWLIALHVTQLTTLPADYAWQLAKPATDFLLLNRGLCHSIVHSALHRYWLMAQRRCCFSVASASCYGRWTSSKRATLILVADQPARRRTVLLLVFHWGLGPLLWALNWPLAGSGAILAIALSVDADFLLCPALPSPALPSLACLALPCLALPCLALPCLALSCLALPCLALPYFSLCLALPCLALPCLALPCLALPSSYNKSQNMFFFRSFHQIRKKNIFWDYWLSLCRNFFGTIYKIKNLKISCFFCWLLKKLIRVFLNLGFRILFFFPKLKKSN